MLVGILADGVAAGYSTSTDPFADAVALWLGLHGFAHQRAVTSTLPWPADLVRRFVSPLSHIGPAHRPDPVREVPRTRLRPRRRPALSRRRRRTPQSAALQPRHLARADLHRGAVPRHPRPLLGAHRRGRRRVRHRRGPRTPPPRPYKPRPCGARPELRRGDTDNRSAQRQSPGPSARGFRRRQGWSHHGLE
ncbi:hypothetical protein [Streptomyces sp. NPDC057617]|uniref:hypothetical protein n=1 Tax=Streptomyces sp. NPDC057617 TaxID=3346184 RepID=UPI00367CF33E